MIVWQTNYDGVLSTSPNRPEVCGFVSVTPFETKNIVDIIIFLQPTPKTKVTMMKMAHSTRIRNAVLSLACFLLSTSCLVAFWWTTFQTDNTDSTLRCLITVVHDMRYITETTTLATNNGEVSHDDEYQHFECNPLLSNGEVSDYSYRIDIPDEFVRKHMGRIIKGELFVSLPGTRIAGDKILFPIDANNDTNHLGVINVLSQSDWGRRIHNRRLQRMLSSGVPTTGTLSVLVVRVSTSDSIPDFTADEYHKLIFDHEVSLRRQYLACSFGKLDLVPTGHGVFDLYLNKTLYQVENATTISRSELVNFAMQELHKVLGVRSTETVSDLLMIILPPMPHQQWAAYAAVGHYRSVYHNRFGGYVSATNHEVGHSFGLTHSNKPGEDYTDFTGYMSAGYQQLHWPAKCFNPQNHWHLGWFEDRSRSIYPLQHEQPELVNVAAFVDYDQTLHSGDGAEYDVLVRVGDDLFLQYNRAKSFNRDTGEKRDMITIVQQMGNTGTDLIAGLDATTRWFEIPNFQGSKHSLVFDVCRVVNGGGMDTDIDQPDYMVVSIGIGSSLCDQQPTAVSTRPTVDQQPETEGAMPSGTTASPQEAMPSDTTSTSSPHGRRNRVLLISSICSSAVAVVLSILICYIRTVLWKPA